MLRQNSVHSTSLLNQRPNKITEGIGPTPIKRWVDITSRQQWTRRWALGISSTDITSMVRTVNGQGKLER
jgi:hypothetical protein